MTPLCGRDENEICFRAVSNSRCSSPCSKRSRVSRHFLRHGVFAGRACFPFGKSFA